MKETLTASLKEEEGKEGPKWRMKGEGYFASQEREEKGGQKLEWKIASKFLPAPATRRQRRCPFCCYKGGEIGLLAG